MTNIIYMLQKKVKNWSSAVQFSISVWWGAISLSLFYIMTKKMAIAIRSHCFLIIISVHHLIMV